MKRALLICVAACGKFQDPNIAVDLRVLELRADKPEQVVSIDFNNPPQPADVLAQLVPATVCALVTDPARTDRQLRWSMSLCEENSDDRCDDPQETIGSGMMDNPDVTVPEPQMCAVVMPDATLLDVVLQTLQGDVLHGLQGEQYMVGLRVGGADEDPANDLYAAKALDVMPNIPAPRAPNQNPYLNEIDVALPDADPVPLQFGRCVDQADPIAVLPNTTLRLTPIEPDGVREQYQLVLLDGSIETFTETLTYQWVASAGGFSSGTTGGKRDVFGNSPPLYSDWTAPAAKDLDGTTDVSIWVLQRDERLGVAWYESCIRVVPSPP